MYAVLAVRMVFSERIKSTSIDLFNAGYSIALPIYFYYAYGVGIRPVGPGRWELKKGRPACRQLFVNAKVVMPQRVVDVGAP